MYMHTYGHYNTSQERTPKFQLVSSFVPGLENLLLGAVPVNSSDDK